jgi:cephalosporin hydroxylase
MPLDDTQYFQKRRKKNIKELSQNYKIKHITNDWFVNASNHGYSYNFDWLGLPIIQFPQDIVAIQEIIWNTKPDLIIETGVARGGSLIFSASMLHLLNGNGKVIGVDIDIKNHNRERIECHPLSDRIKLIQGSSTDQEVVNKIKKDITSNLRVMVILDSNHTHNHVLQEIEIYAPLVTIGCYCLVMDTIVEDMPDNYYNDRPWGKNNNPKTAVHEFLGSSDQFEIDNFIQDKLLITVAPDGYLKRIK